jgi:hypothetical protein
MKVPVAGDRGCECAARQPKVIRFGNHSLVETVPRDNRPFGAGRRA